MKKSLILAVGTGAGVESGIAGSIKENDTDFIVFLVTEESKKTIERIENIRKKKFDAKDCTLKIIKNENDAEGCYEIAREAIKELKKEFKNIRADFTSGTKAMTGGLILAAVAEETLSLSYVMGKRDEKTGRVISGTERIYTIPSPVKILCDAKKDMLMKMFNRYQFDECLKIIEDVKSKTGDEQVLKDFLVLEKLASSYSCWDKFNHKDALEFLRKHDNSLLNIEKNKKFLLEMERNSYKDQKLLIADLLNNAERRFEEGKYDDAVARLYRTMELIAQYRLRMKF